MKPCDARSFDDVLKLRRDNFESGNFWILTDGQFITLCQQESGYAPQQKITLPLKKFNEIINWYTRDQAVKRNKAT